MVQGEAGPFVVCGVEYTTEPGPVIRELGRRIEASGRERQFPDPYEMIDGVESNTTPARALAKLPPEDRELWLEETRQMERYFEEFSPGAFQTRKG
jgi:hypothetical protein